MGKMKIGIYCCLIAVIGWRGWGGGGGIRNAYGSSTKHSLFFFFGLFVFLLLVFFLLLFFFCFCFFFFFCPNPYNSLVVMATERLNFLKRF